MTRFIIQSFLVILLLIGQILFAAAQYQYISPQPDSKYHNPSTNIILRNGNLVDESSLTTKDIFNVVGSLSGEHPCKVKLAEKGKTIILQPEQPFTHGETVSVTIGNGIQTASRQKIEGISFNFNIRQAKTAEENQRIASQMSQLYLEEYGAYNTRSPQPPPAPGFPSFTIDTNVNPAPGVVFWSNFNFFTGLDDHYCIIKSNGDSVFGKYDTIIYNDFDLNKNGYPTVYNDKDSAFLVLDSNYYRIAKYQMGNGYKADPHEFIIDPDGTHFMLAYDPEIVDMTVYNSTYQPNATVIGCIFQVLDNNNNVIFQWRSWDHYSILDGDHINFALGVIDYCHANSIEPDNDGNLIISCRNMSELTKVERSTGNILWRWGGLNNQFTFINDSAKFSYQHDARRISNGNVTLFDNGNYHVPARSYGKEYILDEVNKTATLTWKYSRAISGGNLYAKAMGNMQRLPNGNNFICWGLALNQPTAPKITELDINDNIVWELSLDVSEAIYRAHRHEWEPCARPSATKIYVDAITATTAKVRWLGASNATSYDVQYRKSGLNNWKFRTTNTTDKKLKNLIPDQTYEYRIRSHCSNIATAISGYTSILTFKTLPLKEILTAETFNPSFIVYPNPAVDNIQIQVNSTENSPLTVTIYDMMGRIAFVKKGNIEAGTQVFDYSVNGLASGIYMVEMKTSGNKVVRKIVKE
ncbi:MAG: arylsulfotransferase family protein [Chitinophagales bacterium]